MSVLIVLGIIALQVVAWSFTSHAYFQFSKKQGWSNYEGEQGLAAFFVGIVWPAYWLIMAGRSLQKHNWSEVLQARRRRKQAEKQAERNHELAMAQESTKQAEAATRQLELSGVKARVDVPDRDYIN